MKKQDLEIVLPELVQVRTKLALLTSLDPELFNISEDDYVEHTKELIHGVVKIAKEVTSDLIAVKLQIEYVLKD